MSDVRIDSLRVVWQDDLDADASYLEQDEFAARLSEYRAGSFSFVGCYAEAIVSYSIGRGDRRLEKLRSGGLWGIESDASANYCRDIEREELLDLKAHLGHFGVDRSNWDAIAVDRIDV